MNALAAAQARFDALTPPVDPDFLDSAQVEDWIKTGIDTLLNRGDVTIPQAFGQARVVATHPQLVRQLVDHMAAQLDQACAVEQILIEIIRRGDQDDRLYKLAVAAMGSVEGYETPVHAIAAGMLELHVDDYLTAEAQSLALDAWE